MPAVYVKMGAASPNHIHVSRSKECNMLSNTIYCSKMQDVGLLSILIKLWTTPIALKVFHKRSVSVVGSVSRPKADYFSHTINYFLHFFYCDSHFWQQPAVLHMFLPYDTSGSLYMLLALSLPQAILHVVSEAAVLILKLTLILLQVLPHPCLQNRL